LFFGVPNPLFFGGFSPCAGVSEVGWDIYPTPEKKTAHRGNSGFYCFSQYGWYVFCKCFFSTKPDFLNDCNGFWNFVAVPQQKQNSPIVTLLKLLCDGCGNEKNPSAATTLESL